MSALSSALLTGLSGLVANQTELSVVGNNIANANTTAFKSSQVQFTPQFYVTDDTGSEPTSTFGGTDPSQVGLGTEVASITQNLSQGELQNTGIASDLAINGNGYFIIQPAGAAPGAQNFNYTRDGAFKVNEAGQLVDDEGDFVMGYNADSNFTVNPNGTLAPVVIPSSQEIAQATGTATLTGSLTAGTAATAATTLTSQTIYSATGTLDGTTPLVDLTDASGNPLFTAGDQVTVSAQVGSQAPVTQTFNVTGTASLASYESFLNSTLGINSSSVSTDQVPGVSLISGSAAGSGTIQIVGNVGTVNSLSITDQQTVTSSGGVDPGIPFTVDSAAQNAGVANGTSYSTSQTVYDSLGNPLTLNVNAVESSTSDSGTTWEFFVSSPSNIGGQAISSGTLSFDTSGNLIGATGTSVTLNLAGTGAEVQQPIDLNFSQVDGLGNSAGSGLTMSADGYKAGTIESYSIGADGVITGNFSNGLNETIGQIALANFTNPSGLNNLGNNNYSVGANSGGPTVTTPGSGSAGTLVSGSLEESNVDLSQEFINLIIASTGYDASSRVISTGDQLLQELLSSQR